MHGVAERARLIKLRDGGISERDKPGAESARRTFRCFSITGSSTESAFTRLRDAEMVAPMVGFLASDAAWNINGHVFYVNGGEVSRAHHPSQGRTVYKREMWTLDELDDAVQNVLLKDVPNPAPPRDDVEVPGRDTPAQALI